MKVSRNKDIVQCIMNSEDLEKYDIYIEDMKNGDFNQEILTEKFIYILEDINEELDEDEQIDAGQTMSIEMSVNPQANIVIMRIRTVSSPEEDYDDDYEDDDYYEEEKHNHNGFFGKKDNPKEKVNRNEIQTLAFSFTNMNDVIAFAKQMNFRDMVLRENAKNVSEDDFDTFSEDDPRFKIPERVPDELRNILENFRKQFVDKLNDDRDKHIEQVRNYTVTPTSLYKMNDIYYFICENVIFNEMLGISEEYYTGNIDKEPSPDYIREHGELIIKENVSEKLSQI